MDLLDSRRPVYRTILFLAWPAILEQILQTLVGFVDTAMVGSLGATATAGIAVNSSTVWLIGGVMNSVATGFAVLVARNIGAKDYAKARDLAKQCLVWTVVFALCLSAVMVFVGRNLAIWMNADPEVVVQSRLYMKWIARSYLASFLVVSCSAVLRCSGDTRTPLIANTMNNVINVILNFLLIFPTRNLIVLGNEFHMPGSGLGVEGAAIATAVSAVISASVLVTVCLVKNSPSRIDVRTSWKPRFDALSVSARIGTPVLLERVTLSSGQIALTAIVTSIGTSALAAHYVAITAESITYLPTVGFAVAATTLVAQSLGAQDRELAKRFARTSTLFGTLTISVMGVVLFVFAPQLMGIFSDVPEVIGMGARALRIEAFAEPFFGMSMLVAGILRGAGDTKWPFYISVIGMWIVRIPFAWVLTRTTSLGLSGAWLAMMTDLIVRGIICLVRLLRGKWLYAFDGKKAAAGLT